MTPDQVRAARALLGWGVYQLGVRSGTSRHMVRTFEKTGRVVSLAGYDQPKPVDALSAVRAALEAAGVVFTNGDEAGVKLRKADQ